MKLIKFQRKRRTKTAQKSFFRWHRNSSRISLQFLKKTINQQEDQRISTNLFIAEIKSQ